ncbi:MAG: alpha/beta fold hydrolase [Deltaproteobacteria bacterium]|nr:alpha/beta fold hydrolase [Deltaproteobacteria bacterium]
MPTVRIDDTLEMFYCIDDFTDPWLKPETVLLHHGNAKNHRFWWAWVPILARHYRVVRMDARGFGDSTAPPPGYNWSLEGFATDIARLLDHLGLEKMHFIGETVGGTIGLQFAYQYPDRVKSLTACTSPFKFASSSRGESAAYVEEHGVEAWARSTMHRRLGKDSDPALAEWYAQQMGRTRQSVVKDTLNYTRGIDLTERIRQIKAPTLVIAPADSAGQPAEAYREQQRAIPGARLFMVPGAGGFVQHTHPEVCAKAALDFLRSVG